MKRLSNIAIIIAIGFATFISCEKNESYSEVPEVEFSSYRIYDTIVPTFPSARNIDIFFKFVDGDGDLGYDTLLGGPEQNLIFSRYEQRNGEFVNVDSTLAVENKFTIKYNDQYMKRDGQNKTLKGTIKVILSEGSKIVYDTVKYDFWILDRANNKSNVASTTPITGLKKQ